MSNRGLEGERDPVRKTLLQYWKIEESGRDAIAVEVVRRRSTTAALYHLDLIVGYINIVVVKVKCSYIRWVTSALIVSKLLGFYLYIMRRKG
jgi:hypothetical protein